ncbi:MAG: hypothetical protein KF785_11890 [Gemmatimonadales bacterium]|nr:hypothetical protein [Gemmatimonadales bacterium]
MSSSDPVARVWAVAAAEPSPVEWGLPELGSELRSGVDRESEDLTVDPVAEGRARGFDEGFAAGLAHARAELAPGRETLNRLLTELAREINAATQRAEHNGVAIALAAARWLLQREVAADPSVVEPMIRRAVALLPAGSPVEIHANPTDIEQLGTTLDFTEPDGRALPVHWVADAALERGSFHLISPERIIDGRADTALRALYERIIGD